MTKTDSKKFNILKISYITCILLCIALLVSTPETAISTFGQGVLIWATKILPGLLPFFILTNLLSYTSFISSSGKVIAPFTQKVYGVGGASGYVYVMSILSGYPMGAKLTADLYKNNQISRSQAITISSFTSTSGPLFIIGTVGIGFFGSQKMGITILICHFLGALINGLLYRNKEECTSDYEITTKYSQNFLNDTMTSSITSIMVVGGFVALFYMILSLLNSLGIFEPLALLLQNFGIEKNLTISILSGLIEVTTGELALSKCMLSTELCTMLSTILISFGGLSIHAQAYCFMKEYNMPYYKFLLQKITHAIFSGALSLFILL